MKALPLGPAFLLTHRALPLNRSILFEIHCTRHGSAIASGEVSRNIRKPNTWTLWDAWVSPDFRGHGFQRRLIRARVNYARRHGGKTVEVWVHPRNSFSLNNLVAEGFRFKHGMSRRFKAAKTRFVGLTKDC